MSKCRSFPGNDRSHSITPKSWYYGHLQLQYPNRRRNQSHPVQRQQGLYQLYRSLMSKQTQGSRRWLKVTLLKLRITLFHVPPHSYSSKASSSLISADSIYHFNSFGMMSEWDLHNCDAVQRFFQRGNISKGFTIQRLTKQVMGPNLCCHRRVL